EQRADGHRHLTHLRWIIQLGQKPAIIGGTKNRQVIRLNVPTSRLGEHVHVPAAPAPLAVKEEENGTENRATHHRNRAPIVSQPTSGITQGAPTFAKQI